MVLPLALALALAGLVMMPLVPGPYHSNWTDYWFRLSPLLLAGLVILLAAWLRAQQALDPGYEGKGGGSLSGNFGIYAAAIICLVLIARALLE